MANQKFTFMKTKFTLLIFLAFIWAGKLQAQVLLSEDPNALGGSSDFGYYLRSLANGIRPEAFNNTWMPVKDGWMEKLKNVQMEDITTYGKMAGELVGNLKSSAFTSGFDVKSLTNSLNSPKDRSSLAGSLSNLIKGLDKSVYTDDFAKNLDSYNSGLERMRGK